MAKSTGSSTSFHEQSCLPHSLAPFEASATHPIPLPQHRNTSPLLLLLLLLLLLNHMPTSKNTRCLVCSHPFTLPTSHSPTLARHACVQACVGVDLLVLEGMGRAVHTNFKARFTCDVLKLAMIKTERLAQKLFGGNLYDCVCVFDTGVAPGPGPVSPDPTAA